MTRPQTDQHAPLPRLFEGEQILIALGILGAVLSAILGILLLVKGRYFGAEGDLLKPIEFNLAVGLFFINVAAFLPLAGFKPWARVTWRWVNVVLILAGYTTETMQTVRGYDPRFTHLLHGLLASSPRIIISAVGVAWAVFTVALAIAFFRNPDPRYDRLRLGLKYGLISCLVAVAGGLWMIASHGRYTGPAGNILLVHFIGFEGLKTMLITAYLAERSELQWSPASRWIHLAGLGWLAACAAISAQTALGKSLFTLAPLPLLTLVALAVWGYATLQLRSAAPRPNPVAAAATR